MLLVVLGINTMMSAAVPSPGYILWRDIEQNSVANLWLAQSTNDQVHDHDHDHDKDEARKEEEESLQRDMERSRQRLRPEEAGGIKHDVEGHSHEDLKHAAGDHEGHNHGDPDLDKQSRRHQNSGHQTRSRQINNSSHRHWPPPNYLRPNINGHKKGYYLTWGIVDWSLAGGGWFLGGILTLIAANSWAIANKDGPLDDDERYPFGTASEKVLKLRKRDYRARAIGFGIASVVFGAGGGVFSWRAGNNIGNFKKLKRLEREDRRNYYSDE